MFAGPAGPWVVIPRRNGAAALRLICLPYAGGGPSVFRQWPDRLPDDIELWAVELPGRERRARERPLCAMSDVVTQLTDALAPVLDAPFAIFGHSLGAHLGFQLARELRRRGRAAPVHLFASGGRAPQLPDPAPIHHLPDARFVEQLRGLGGIPDAVLHEPELMAYLLPVLRADLAVVEAETYVDEPPLGCPITAFGGLSDPMLPAPGLAAWGAQTTAAFDWEAFPGGHFFLNTARDALLDALSRRLAVITRAA